MRRFLVLASFLALLAPHLFGQGAVATLRTGDVFDMRLGGAPAQFTQEFSFQYTVGQDGTINVPHIGEIKAEGLTSTQLERTIQNRLMAEKIFKTPTVIISIAPVARFVSVNGGVRAPSRVAWTPDLTLTTAIGAAGGFSEFGSQKGIRLIRGGQVFGTYNWKDVNLDPSRDPRVLPGDQVVVRD